MAALSQFTVDIKTTTERTHRLFRQMIRIKNFTIGELRASYRFQSRSILLQFFFVFCFFSKVCEFNKLCRRNEHSSTSLGLCWLSHFSTSLYSVVSLLLVSNCFAFWLSHCLSTYFGKHANFLPFSRLKR